MCKKILILIFSIFFIIAVNVAAEQKTIYLDTMTVDESDKDDIKCNNRYEDLDYSKSNDDEELRPIFVLGFPHDQLPQDIIIEKAEFNYYLYNKQNSGPIKSYISYTQSDNDCDQCMDWYDAFDQCSIDSGDQVIDEFNAQDNVWRKADVTNQVKSAYENKKYVAMWMRRGDSDDSVEQDFLGEDHPSKNPYILVTYTQSQCTSGVCCNTEAQQFKPSSTICQVNANAEYGCPWGVNLGDDLGINYQDRYCSGSSANCEGQLQWKGWQLASACNQNQLCVSSSQTCFTVQCSQETDCGKDEFIDNKYCSNGNLVQKFRDHTCFNPGKTDSKCQWTDKEIVVESCTYGCESSSCNSEPTTTTTSTTTTTLPLIPETTTTTSTTTTTLPLIPETTTTTITTTTTLPQPEQKDDNELPLIFNYEPSFSLGNNLIWKYLGNYKEKQQITFTEQLQEYLKTCTQDSEGYCTIQLNLGLKSAGKISLSSLAIAYDIEKIPIVEPQKNNEPQIPVQTPAPAEKVCSEEIPSDNIDNDCDGITDEECINGETKYCGVNTGECEMGQQTCRNGKWSACEGERKPSQEACDGLDNDCNGAIDNGFGNIFTYYFDYDEDGFGIEDVMTLYNVCAPPSNKYSLNKDDCNDKNKNVNPDANEFCDFNDNDCNGLIDEDESGKEWGLRKLIFFDKDGDGYGSTKEHNAESICKDQQTTQNMVENKLDCNDNEHSINPSVEEICDSIDNNCNGIIDENNVCRFNPADLNDNDCIEFQDYTLFMSAFDKKNLLADLDKNGIAEFADIVLFLRDYGKCK